MRATWNDGWILSWDLQLTFRVRGLRNVIHQPPFEVSSVGLDEGVLGGNNGLKSFLEEREQDATEQPALPAIFWG